MKNLCKMNLKMFGNEKDFFTNAFNEAYNITEGTSDAIEEPESDSTPEVEQIPNEVTQKPEEAPQEVKELSDEELANLYKERFGEPETPELDEETQSALELYKYLEQNAHLVQAMREIDAQGYQQLNQYIPDEITKQLNELKDFKAEIEYREYIKDLKSKYSDFDEDKVLEYAEQVDITDLEVAYKAMNADSVKEPDIEALREQIKQELLEELKNNSINTQSLVGGVNQKPINANENIKLSSKEQRIAKAMGLTPSEYYKWR